MKSASMATISKGTLLLLILLFLVKTINCQNLSSLNLSANVLINGDFSQPDVGGATRVIYTSGVLGWNFDVNIQISDCSAVNLTNGCPHQYTDLVTLPGHHQNITQNVNLSEGEYLLSITYFLPASNPTAKRLEFYLNNNLIFNQTTTGSTQENVPRYFEAIVSTINGSNSISLVSAGNPSDGLGYRISLVQLRQVLAYNQSNFGFLVENIYNNIAQFKIFGIPGVRVILKNFMAYFISLDRLEFYFYHMRNYSYYSYVLISNVNYIQNRKSQVIKSSFETAFPSTMKTCSQSLEYADYKKNYTDQRILQKNEAGDGLILNNIDDFLYFIPFVFVIEIIFYIMFHLLKKRPISIIFRKYSFLCMIFPLIVEGNVEKFTYYMTGQFLLFFSANFKHKLINLFLLYFYFMIFFFGVFGFFWYKILYKNKVGYFMDNNKIDLLAIQCSSIDRGFIGFLFGVVHRLLIFQPQTQLLVLGIVEVAWLAMKVYYIHKKAYKSNLKVWMINLSGFIRILFQITFYFFSKYEDERSWINQNIHLPLIALFLVLWGLELLCSSYEFIKEIFQFCQVVRKDKEDKKEKKKQTKKQSSQDKKEKDQLKDQDKIDYSKNGVIYKNGQKILIFPNKNKNPKGLTIEELRVKRQIQIKLLNQRSKEKKKQSQPKYRTIIKDKESKKNDNLLIKESTK